MFCKKITAHWREKDHWLKAEHKNSKKCEIWDGLNMHGFGTLLLYGFSLPSVHFSSMQCVANMLVKCPSRT